MDTSPRFHAVVPAAGVGARVGAPVPKQFLMLAGHSLLQWSVGALLAAPFIDTVLVVVAPDDTRAADQVGLWPRVRVLPVGGASRRDSVLAGVTAGLQGAMGARGAAAQAAWRRDDWVLVHDAARPGLSLAALTRLRDALRDDPVGGLLALPVSDTVKQTDTALSRGAQARVAATLPRESLWLAQTPQMFRVGVLSDALAAHPAVTDEAGAIEAAGLWPRLVEGERQNFKVTTPEDLDLMAAWLATRPEGPAGARRAATSAGEQT